MAIDLSYLKELVSARDELERRMKEGARGELRAHPSCLGLGCASGSRRTATTQPIAA